MTRRSRRILFYSLALVFIVAAGGAALYAQGWRLDLLTLTPAKVGAIYIRSVPADAEISLNGKSVHRAFSFFQTGLLVNNLFPRDYRVEIRKDGYETVSRRLSVQPAMVATAKYVVLVPKTATPVETAPTSDFVVVKNEFARLTPEGRILWRERTLPGTAILGATEDGNRLLTLDTAKHQYFWNDLATPTTTAISPLLRTAGLTAAQEKTATVILDPEDSSRVLVRLPGRLAALDLQNRRLTTLGTTTSTTTIGRVAASRNRIAWVVAHEAEQSSQLFIYNNGQNSTEPTGLPLIAGRTIGLAWLPTGALGIVQDNGTFYLYDPDRRELRPQASDVKSFVASAEGNLLATLEHRSLEVFSLAGTDYWRFNLPNMETVAKIEWYADYYHLLVHYPDRVMLLDFEDTSLESFQVAAATNRAEYRIEENALYFLGREQVMKLAFPER